MIHLLIFCHCLRGPHQNRRYADITLCIDAILVLGGTNRFLMMSHGRPTCLRQSDIFDLGFSLVKSTLKCVVPPHDTVASCPLALRCVWPWFFTWPCQTTNTEVHIRNFLQRIKPLRHMLHAQTLRGCHRHSSLCADVEDANPSYQWRGNDHQINSSKRRFGDGLPELLIEAGMVFGTEVPTLIQNRPTSVVFTARKLVTTRPSSKGARLTNL